MAGVNKMAGSPWHTELMARKEGDPRRHRSKCKYHSSKDNYCLQRSMKCVGSAHCKYYSVAPESTPPIPAKVVSPDAVQQFKGIKQIPLNSIIVDKTYHQPNKKNIQKIQKYYEEHGKFDRPIIVSCRESGYVLEDNYLCYFVATLLGLKYVSARIGKRCDIALENYLRKVGKRIKHKHYGEGIIIKSSLEYVEIKFDSGKTITFDIKACIDMRIITPP